MVTKIEVDHPSEQSPGGEGYRHLPSPPPHSASTSPSLLAGAASASASSSPSAARFPVLGTTADVRAMMAAASSVRVSPGPATAAGHHCFAPILPIAAGAGGSPGAAAATATAGLFAKARRAQLEAAHAEKEYLRAKKEAAEMAARIAQQEFLLARHQLQRIEAHKAAQAQAQAQAQGAAAARDVLARAVMLPPYAAPPAVAAPLMPMMCAFPRAVVASGLSEAIPQPEEVPSFTPPLQGEDLLRSLSNKKKRTIAAAMPMPTIPTASSCGAAVTVAPPAATASNLTTGVVPPPPKKAKKQMEEDAKDERLKDLFMPKYPLTAYNYFFSVEREKILSALSKGGPDVSAELDAAEDDASRERAVSDLLSRSATDKEHESFERRWTDKMNADQLLRYDPNKKRKRLHRKTHGKIGFVHLARIISSRWRALPTGRVEFYRNLAEADMLRWKEAMKEYRQNKALVEMGLAFNVPLQKQQQPQEAQ